MWLCGALIYMVLLSFSAMITPGLGIAGSLLALLPQSVTELSHIPAYGLLTWWLTSAFQERGWPKKMALQAAVLASMAFGLSMELLQVFVPGRVVDPGDVALNAIGIGCAALVVGATPEAWLYPLATKSQRR